MALQEQCVASIATVIEEYHRLFSTTEDRNLRRGFHLLQKAYSHELVSQLQARGNLEGKYVDLVFSKYLRSLDTKAFARFSAEDIIHTLARIGPNLEEIYFNEEFQPNVQWEEIIHHLSNVKVLTFRAHCSDAILQRIAAHCPRLETLNVSSSPRVTDAGLEHLCLVKRGKKRDGEGTCLPQKVPCPLLKNIVLYDTSVDEWGIKQLLENLPSLEKIVHSKVPYALYLMHKDDLGYPDRMKKYDLTHLDLQPTARSHRSIYDDILKVSVTSCPNVKSLTSYVLEPEHLTLFSTLSNVEDVTLSNIGGVSIDVNGFLKERGTNLASLSLGGFTLSLSVLAHGCPRLRQLRLTLVTFQDDANDSLPVFQELETATIFYVDLSVSTNFRGVCHVLKSSPLLEDLRFFSYFDCRLLPSDMKKEILKCCELRALKRIIFYCCSIELQFLKDILETCSSLKTLELCHSLNSVSREDLEKIADSVPNKPLILVSN